MSPLNRRLRKSIELLKPPPKQTVSEWAVTNRILSSEASPVGYFIAQDPAPILVIQPTLEMAQT